MKRSLGDEENEADRRTRVLLSYRDSGSRSPEDDKRLSGLKAPLVGFMSSLFRPRPPAVEEKKDEDVANATIVRELNALTLRERENMFDEIHGVADSVVETEEFFDAKLAALNKALNSIHVKPAYNQAKFIDPASVNDRDLRIRMLRTDYYDVAKAAKRLVNHFAFKLELFGLDRLVEPIHQDDLSPSMFECLYLGDYQFSTQKDRSGRSIVYLRNIHEQHDENWNSRMGMLYYIHVEAMKDFEDQKKGIVTIMEASDRIEFDKNYLHLLKRSAFFQESVPYKMVAFHYLYQDSTLMPALKFILANLHKVIQVRMRTHFGSILECIYQLMSYGITKEMLPLDDNGDMEFERWRERLRRRREEERTRSRRTDLPRSKDVLLGRGCPYQVWPGNVYLARVIEYNRSLYESKMRGEKSNVSNAILAHLRHERGARFLKRNEESSGPLWIDVTEKEARYKISYGFRSPARPNLKDNATLGAYNYPATGDQIHVPMDAAEVSDSE